MSKIRRVILETLGQHDALPIDALARATRHSVLATRYHLGVLINEGLVSAQPAAPAVSAGRPQMLYALADSAHEELPKQYNEFAARLLDEIADTLGEKETRTLLRRAGKKLAASAAPLRKSTRIETRLERTVDFLSARGYMAQWEKLERDYALYVRNCPYRQVALTHRQVCEMDLALVDELMDFPMRMTQSIAHHDRQCTFLIRSNRSKK